MRHLQSLEADLFDELPGGILRKGIVRSYCQHLGLNEEAWLKRIADHGGFEEPEQDLAKFAENVHRARLEAMAPVRQRWWGVAVLLCVLAVLGYMLWHYVVQPRVGVRHPYPEIPASTTLLAPPLLTRQYDAAKTSGLGGFPGER